MSKIVLEGRIRDVDLSLIPFNIKDSDGFTRNVGYRGMLQFAIQRESETPKTRKMPLHVSNEFDAGVISRGLEGQRAVYSEEIIEVGDGTGSYTSMSLEVRSGQYEGVKFRAKI